MRNLWRVSLVFVVALVAGVQPGAQVRPAGGAATPASRAGEAGKQAAAREALAVRLIDAVDKRFDTYDALQKQIWALAEVGYQEEKSSRLLQSYLAANGFDVRAGVADEPTSFVASYGSGKPVIAFLAEFDALPGLSQQAVPEKKPVLAGAPGHGCGHNLLGVGAVAAAVAVKDWLASEKRTGTVRVHGTPAEEGGAGKVYQVRAGLFDAVDVVIDWHPGDRNEARARSSLANISAKFRFHGISTSAAGAAHKGRSAVDGVQAMTYMVELMREHVPQETRIHYIITRGGATPNVVPDFAELWLYARQPNAEVLDGVWTRIIDTARAAAMGTGTTVDYEVIHGAYSLLPNQYLATLVGGNLERVGGVKYSAEEQAFAEQLRKTFPPEDPDVPSLSPGSQEKVQPMQSTIETGDFSTDVGDVSWTVPVAGQLSAACWPPGTPGHSWQAVAAGGTTIGTKGAMVAAKTMALTAADLFTNPEHIRQARAEFEKRRGANFVYKARVGDRKPPLDYRR
jgi:aminobenzoyl-glutamate utilization protein B